MDFAIITRSETGPTFIEERADFQTAVERAKEIAVENKSECFVYCYRDSKWKYKAEAPAGES